MDDWWYYGYKGSRYWSGEVGVRSISHWVPSSEYYPGGLANLSKSIQVPLLLYGPYFWPENDWSGEFEFIPQGSDYVLPAPQQSYDFYSTLFDFGISTSTNGPNTGMIGYELDWVAPLTATPYLQTHIDTAQQWLKGMNKAAKERGITIQFCIANPMNLLQALSLSQVTNGRASDDYAGSENWDIGAGSLLWSALDLKPSKDNFWTSWNEPVTHRNGNDQNSTEVHAIIAILSLGPVGISDAAGYSNATLINRLCRTDGRLLQPSRPVTSIDDQFILNVFSSQSINIWSTEFGPKNNINLYRIVFAVDMPMTVKYDMKYSSLLPALNSNFGYVVRKWHNYTNCMDNGSLAIQSNCIQYVAPNSKHLYSFTTQPIISLMRHSFELVHIVQSSFEDVVLLGELNKYVSASMHRFDNLVIDGSKLSVDIKGSKNENVQITVLLPVANKNDWTVNIYNIMIPAAGTITFSV
eukprot:48172_1